MEGQGSHLKRELFRIGNEITSMVDKCLLVDVKEVNLYNDLAAQLKKIIKQSVASEWKLNIRVSDERLKQYFNTNNDKRELLTFVRFKGERPLCWCWQVYHETAYDETISPAKLMTPEQILKKFKITL